MGWPNHTWENMAAIKQKTDVNDILCLLNVNNEFMNTETVCINKHIFTVCVTFFKN